VVIVRLKRRHAHVARTILSYNINFKASERDSAICELLDDVRGQRNPILCNPEHFRVFIGYGMRDHLEVVSSVFRLVARQCIGRRRICTIHRLGKSQACQTEKQHSAYLVDLVAQ